jgi:histidinol-phosphate aminotransferase
MIQPREAVVRLKKYRPPLEGRAGKLRLDFNENTVGCPPEVARALKRALTPEALSRYPEYEQGREILARYFKVAPHQMLLTNGTDDAIKLICDTFVDPEDVLVVPAPTFPVFSFFHSVAGGRTVEVRFDEQFHLPLDRLLAAINRRTRWVALANPNNPTGTMLPKKDLAAVLDGAPGTVILVDEAYYDFSGETVLPWIQKYPNLVVSRTFSKAFGLAALRMGCLFASEKLAESLHRAQNPFAVNALALAAALEAIRHEAAVKRYAGAIRRNREEFCTWLESREIPYVASHANFVLTRVGERAPEIARRLRDEGILVRDWSYDPHLRGYLRFTIGSKPQMRRLVEELSRMEHRMDARDGSSAWKNFVTFSQTGWFA